VLGGGLAFPDVPIWEGVLAVLVVMILGESIGRQYGTWGEKS
jgi:hypothetical protein